MAAKPIASPTRAALRSGSGDDNDEIPADFQAAYMQALQDRGINVQMLDATIDSLFAGHPELYAALVKRLNAFPAGQQLAAYVRSAEAVMTYMRLRKYVS